MDAPIPDDVLRLIFTCCHPALRRDAQVALTLRLVAGLTTAEISAAFLLSESTVAQRIVRAKRSIRERRLPYRVPDAGELPERLPAVLEVLYLVFNEGYAARTGETLVRVDLCEEAIRLARLLAELLPEVAESHGLLALLELQASRSGARVDAEGNRVILEDQNRARWDRLAIERGRRHLAEAVARGPVGPYTLQAAIADCHTQAPSWDETDWRRIVELYDGLERLTRSPVVALNRAVALAMRDGPSAGLVALDQIDAEPALRDYPWLPAARADLLRRLGRRRDAAAEYRKAIELTENARERHFLERRLAEC